MAYLVDIAVHCDVAGCNSRAVAELFDWRNESRGRFCRNHGKQKLRERQAFEKNNPDMR